MVGSVLQLRSGKPFEQFMKDEVFGPLEMTSSTFSQMEAAAHPSFALGHTRDKTLPVPAIPMIPSGGMYSTVKDMAKYVSFQLTGGRVNGKPIIRASLLKEMYTPQFAIEGQLGGWLRHRDVPAA
jgi:CubicO group peptidase (beta-lactamase class C family)